MANHRAQRLHRRGELSDRCFLSLICFPLSHEQARETYTFLDGSYALINEYQVGFGESTCSARLVNTPIHDGEQAIASNRRVIQLMFWGYQAARRCST